MELVLVTGAGGFIGRHIVRLLASRGYSVRATDLRAEDLAYAREMGAQVSAGDLKDHRFVAAAVEGVDSVIHPAAAFDLGLPRKVLIDTNVTTTANMARAAARAGVRMFVDFSTCDVFGYVSRGPTDEDDPKQPRCAYSRSKLLSELTAFGVMDREGLPVAVVRPTFVYGPGAIYTARSFVLLPSLLAKHVRSLPLPHGGPRTNTIHVEDVASATVAVLEAGEAAAGRAFDIADDSLMCAFEFLRTIFEPFGITCRETAIPYAVIEATGKLMSRLPIRVFEMVNRFLTGKWDAVIVDNALEPLLSPKLDRDFAGFLSGEHLYSNDRAKSLGWEPRYPTFADGWPPTVEWYRANNYIP